MPSEQGSTVPRRRLGRELRRLREAAHITIEAATDQLEWSRQKIWRIERGEPAMRALDVEAMCKIYGAPKDLTEALKALAKETKARGWYHAYGDVIPKWFEIYIDLETTASLQEVYNGELVDGLLQTRSYIEAILRTSTVHTAADIERIVEVRIARQSVLGNDGKKFDFILNEAAIRRPVGGPLAIGHQLRQLAAMSEHSNISIRILPFATGAHGAMLGSFRVLDFPADSEPDTVYIEQLTGALYLDKAHELEPYRDQFRNIGNLALDQRKSRDLILAAEKEFCSG
ncbi:helix-turn-helix transcriptional regulator [Fodinicola feengrottensis]|uniref:Helix-turn-helix transcriptional regulator n=1 Tax=Fodinicola feengrottensis TaxID=435914 RepID=A0ABP4SVW8_9ACTN